MFLQSRAPGGKAPGRSLGQVVGWRGKGGAPVLPIGVEAGGVARGRRRSADGVVG